MKQDLRYKIQHTGDYFVGAICDVVDVAKGSAKGIVLTYNINELKRKKSKIVKKIGEKLIQLKKDDSELRVSDDDSIKNLFSELEKIQNRIDTYVNERGV